MLSKLKMKSIVSSLLAAVTIGGHFIGKAFAMEEDSYCDDLSIYMNEETSNVVFEEAFDDSSYREFMIHDWYTTPQYYDMHRCLIYKIRNIGYLCPMYLILCLSNIARKCKRNLDGLRLNEDSMEKIRKWLLLLSDMIDTTVFNNNEKLVIDEIHNFIWFICGTYGIGALSLDTNDYMRYNTADIIFNLSLKLVLDGYDSPSKSTLCSCIKDLASSL